MLPNKKTKLNMVILLTAMSVLLSAMAPGIEAACVEPPSGLVGWWPGDGDADDIWSDNHGTLMNGATFAPGKVDQAFSLDGVDDYVDVGNDANLNIGTGDFAVEFWVLVNDSQWNSILYKYSSGTSSSHKHYRIHAAQTTIGDPGDPSDDEYVDSIVVTVGDGGQWYINWQWAEITLGEWQHIAWVLDRDDGSYIYVNGVLESYLQRTNSVDISNPGNLTIGTPSNSLNGLIDEVEIFNRALSASEIQAIYNAGSAGKCKIEAACVEPPSGLVGWWPGDGDADDIWSDNHGTLMNGATFAPGKVDQAFSLDGVDDYVDVGNDANLNIGTGDFAVEFWVLVNDSQWNSILYKYSSGTSSSHKHYRIHAAQTTIGDPGDPSDDEYVDSIVVTVGDGGQWYINWQWAEITLGEWQHIAWVLDRDDGSYIYVNGVLESYLQRTNSVDISNPGNLTIGTPSNSLNGLIDEVEIFNRALSASEIQAIYNAGSAGKCKIDPVGDLQDLIGLISFFDPGDFSNSNHQKTLVNMVNAIINGLDLNDVASICDAINKLTKSILSKTDGVTPPPDWVTDPMAQQQLEAAINDIIDTLQGLANSLGGC